MRAYLSSFLLLAAVVVVNSPAAELFFPEIAFDPRPNRGAALPEEQRRKILDALSHPDRDRRLEALIGSRNIGGENWYDLSGLEIRKGDLTAKANFTRICWDYARFDELNLAGANFNGALLRHATFYGVNLESAIFDDAHLEGADFKDCVLSGATILRVAFSSTTQFRECNLGGAHLALARSVPRASEITESPPGVKFSGGVLKGASFQKAVLLNAEFVNTDLTDVDFSDADLTAACFYNTVINGCDFTDAKLVRSKLSSAKLTTGLRLVRTTLGAPELGDLDISKIDMTYVQWRYRDYRVGEEIMADALLASENSQSASAMAAESYARAENIYRSLAQRYKSSGYLEEYLGLHVRSMESRRKILRLTKSNPFSVERMLLEMSGLIDRHGTSFSRYLESLFFTLAVFTVVFSFIFLMWGGWFNWYVTNPDGNELAVDKNGAYISIASPLTDTNPRAAGNHLFKRFTRSLPVGFLLSIEAFFRFIEHIIDVPNLTHVFRKHDIRPLPKSRIARLIYGTEGVCGLIFLYCGSRMLLLLVGSQ